MESILLFQKIIEDRFNKNRILPGSIRPHGYDTEMTVLSNLCSKWVCDLVKKEYDFALDRDNNMMQFTQLNQNKNQVKVYYILNNHVYYINLEDQTCTCGFYNVYLLPCKHIICYRSVFNLIPIIPFDFIPDRWKIHAINTLKKNNNSKEEHYTSNTVEVIVSNEMIKKKQLKTLSINEKYSQIMIVFKEIASTMADIMGTNDFLLKKQEFEMVLRNLKTTGEIQMFTNTLCSTCNNNEGSSNSSQYDKSFSQLLKETCISDKTT